jgi:hypothetical protein
MSDSLKETGRCAAASIIEMVAALECDYDRLEELVMQRAEWIAENPGKFIDPNDTRSNWSLAFPDENDELGELAEAAGECTSTDDARQRIEEDPLSVEVRGDWHSIGDQSGLNQATEFKILLCTGGPAVQIRGELENGEPSRAWLEVQDWGTPWTQYFDISQDALLAYARVFYFGES